MNHNDPGAQHVQSRLMRESLVDKNVIARTESPVTAILPDVNVIQIGGRSIMDRGRSAMLRLVGDNLRQQGQQSGASTVHDGAPSDLYDVDVRQNSGDVRFRSGDHVLVNQ
jgi:hypothetical protein